MNFIIDNNMFQKLKFKSGTAWKSIWKVLALENGFCIRWIKITVILTQESTSKTDFIAKMKFKIKSIKTYFFAIMKALLMKMIKILKKMKSHLVEVFTQTFINLIMLDICKAVTNILKVFWWGKIKDFNKVFGPKIKLKKEMHIKLLIWCIIRMIKKEKIT